MPKNKRTLKNKLTTEDDTEWLRASLRKEYDRRARLPVGAGPNNSRLGADKIHPSDKEARPKQVKADLRNIGARVRYYREMLDLTVWELEKRAKVRGLVHLEEGLTDQRISVMCRLARCLEVEPARLFE